MKSSQNVSPVASAARSVVESLEGRTLLSSVALHEGVLRVIGTDHSDRIVVSYGRKDPSMLVVKNGPIVKQYKAGDVGRIDIEALGGNDQAIVQELYGRISIPVSINGGAGKDTIQGGSGNDTLDGGDGNDMLRGQEGDDKLFGGMGDDRLMSGTGVDSLDGGLGDDKINSGNGRDSVTGGGGNDVIDTQSASMLTPNVVLQQQKAAAAAKVKKLRGPNPIVKRPPTRFKGITRDKYIFTSTPVGYTPAQMRHAYGADQLDNKKNTKLPANFFNDGRGQTIVIVDAFDDPNIEADLKAFDKEFNLPDPPSFSVQYAAGSPSGIVDPGWAQETALDVQWAHTFAPMANIILVEAASDLNDDIYAAVAFGVQQIKTDGGVLSMSFGGPEQALDRRLDAAVFGVDDAKTVSFLASSGDTAGIVSYPSVSPFVTSVGGTNLPLDIDGNLVGEETAWDQGGGGVSGVFERPAYQDGLVVNGVPIGPNRTVPDVSGNADPATAVAVYNTVPDAFGDAGWQAIGGTSASCPEWAGMVATSNELRRALNNAVPKVDTVIGRNLNDKIYNIAKIAYDNNFNDIINGANGDPAGPGYDLATGFGSPKIPNLIPSLAGFLSGPTDFQSSFIFPLTSPLNELGNIHFYGAGTTRIAANSVNMTLGIINNNGPDLTDSANITIDNPLTRRGDLVRGTGTANVTIDGTQYTFPLIIKGEVYRLKKKDHIRGDIFFPGADGKPARKGLQAIYFGKFNQ